MNSRNGQLLKVTDAGDTSLSAHLFTLKRTAFVLWRPRKTASAPKLVIGQFQAGNPNTLAGRQEFELSQAADQPDLWHIGASACGLLDGRVYHYWFEVIDSSIFRHPQQRILCTDPTAFTVDWRLRAPLLPAPYSDDDRQPAGVTMFQGGELVSCDPGGETSGSAQRIARDATAPNNRLVIYELPTSWTSRNPHGDSQVGVGTFRDVIALVDRNAAAINFAGIPALEPGRSHLEELGVNAIELLPPADSFVDREWGYATSNYCAPDHDLGLPIDHFSPTPNRDLKNLVAACHAGKIRFFADMVMAFATRGPYEHINFEDFHIDPEREPRDPDAMQSGNQGTRDGFGGRLLRYSFQTDSYDPLTGGRRSLFPAREWMKAYLVRWMEDFAIDGIRMDSVNNVANWDFVQEFKDLARGTWRDAGGADDQFLVVGEELSVPLELVTQNRLDGLWNEEFKRMLRFALLGKNSEKEPSFEWTVRKIIDCRLLGFADGAEAINYVGSHDVGGFQNERLYNFLNNNGVFETEQRIKLAFACLMTAVGIPMIFAGDEFADEHDLSTAHPPKQRDAVNFERADEPFRRRVFQYVARLVKFRTSSDALAVNDTDFIHVDFNDGKRVLVWQRGRPGIDNLVAVVANFSDFGTPHAGSPDAEYVVRSWPATPDGKRWREITQEREVPREWIGREPIFPWEAKVYTLL
jgi:pullulanase